MNASLHPTTPLHLLTRSLVASYTECGRLNYLGHEPLPSREGVIDLLTGLNEVIYPGFGLRQNLHRQNIEFYVGSLLDALSGKLALQVARALAHLARSQTMPAESRADQAHHIAIEFLGRLPKIRDLLDHDVQAAYRGDPAARNHAEIIFCYPGLEAVTVYRLAHELHLLGVPYVPRMMTEFAHSKTGIDIHPGATIGPGFFIDHGTGVVIGETCVIGTGVRLYQGVTLGALSFPKDSEGELIRGTKRHPTLEDEVVVYANATVLGGDTVVGARSVIGSNVWLTESVAPESVVVIEKPRLRLKGGRPAPDRDAMWYI